MKKYIKMNKHNEFHVSTFSWKVHFFIDLASFSRNMSVSSFEVNAAAAMRDYYVEPRLGMKTKNSS